MIQKRIKLAIQAPRNPAIPNMLLQQNIQGEIFAAISAIGRTLHPIDMSKGK
jgi:hypothetical protein